MYIYEIIWCTDFPITKKKRNKTFYTSKIHLRMLTNPLGSGFGVKNGILPNHIQTLGNVVHLGFGRELYTSNDVRSTQPNFSTDCENT
jgi:hypothetical protein